jgi:hypothetical protein
MKASNSFKCYISIYGSTVFCWNLAAFWVSYSYTQSVGLLGRGISPSQGRYLHTEQPIQTQNKRTQTFMSWVGFAPTTPVFVNEDSSCLRPRGHFDRLKCYLLVHTKVISTKTWNIWCNRHYFSMRLASYSIIFLIFTGKTLSCLLKSVSLYYTPCRFLTYTHLKLLRSAIRRRRHHIHHHHHQHHHQERITTSSSVKVVVLMLDLGYSGR